MGLRSPTEWQFLRLCGLLKSIGSLCCSVCNEKHHSVLNNGMTSWLLQLTAMLPTGWCHITLSLVKKLPPLWCSILSKFFHHLFWRDVLLHNVFAFLKLLKILLLLIIIFIAWYDFIVLLCGWFTAYKVWKYADPIGAILICIYILVSWFHMGCGKFSFLTLLIVCNVHYCPVWQINGFLTIWYSICWLDSQPNLMHGTAKK